MIILMGGGYGEPLAMAGYVVGLLVTGVAGAWVDAAGSVGEVLFMCEALFAVALLMGLVRFVLSFVRGRRPGRGGS